jgi:hypothetical protein
MAASKLVGNPESVPECTAYRPLVQRAETQLRSIYAGLNNCTINGCNLRFEAVIPDVLALAQHGGLSDIRRRLLHFLSSADGGRGAIQVYGPDDFGQADFCHTEMRDVIVEGGPYNLHRVLAAESALVYTADGGSLRLIYASLKEGLFDGGRLATAMQTARAGGAISVLPRDALMLHVVDWPEDQNGQISHNLAYHLRIPQESAAHILTRLPALSDLVQGSVEHGHFWLRLVMKLECVRQTLPSGQNWQAAFTCAFQRSRGNLFGTVTPRELAGCLLHLRRGANRGQKSLMVQLLCSHLFVLWPEFSLDERLDHLEMLIRTLTPSIEAWPQSKPLSDRDYTDRWWRIVPEKGIEQFIQHAVDLFVQHLPLTSRRLDWRMLPILTVVNPLVARVFSILEVILDEFKVSGVVGEQGWDLEDGWPDGGFGGDERRRLLIVAVAVTCACLHARRPSQQKRNANPPGNNNVPVPQAMAMHWGEWSIGLFEHGQLHKTMAIFVKLGLVDQARGTTDPACTFIREWVVPRDVEDRLQVLEEYCEGCFDRRFSTEPDDEDAAAAAGVPEDVAEGVECDDDELVAGATGRRRRRRNADLQLIAQNAGGGGGGGGGGGLGAVGGVDDEDDDVDDVVHIDPDSDDEVNEARLFRLPARRRLNADQQLIRDAGGAAVVSGSPPGRRRRRRN